jgi:hypothetical protein
MWIRMNRLLDRTLYCGIVLLGNGIVFCTIEALFVVCFFFLVCIEYIPATLD